MSAIKLSACAVKCSMFIVRAPPAVARKDLWECMEPVL